MISTKTKFPALIAIFCIGLTVLGCQNFSRLFKKGGTIFTVEIETDEPNREEIIERAVKVTQNKINVVGLDGEVTRIPEKANQISVKIYAAEDPEKIKKFLFTTYRLELKKVISPPSPSPLQTFPTKEAAEQIASADQEVLPFSEKDTSSPPSFIIVEKKAIVTGDDVRDASAIETSGSLYDYSIAFSLKPEGAAKFGEWTGKNINNYLAIVLDKKVQSAPFIKSQIFDSGTIDGSFTKRSAEDIALTLKSGYLPATMKLLEEKTFEN